MVLIMKLNLLDYLSFIYEDETLKVDFLFVSFTIFIVTSNSISFIPKLFALTLSIFCFIVDGTPTLNKVFLALLILDS